MKKITRKILLLVIATVMLFSVRIFAADEFKGIEKSAEFEKWENLSEEERKNAIQPAYQTINFKDSVKRSTYNNLLNLRENTHNTYYSLKDYIDIEVKNQDYTNTCWAFSFSSVLETTYAKKLNINREYSPMHIELKSAKMFNREIDEGGNANLSVAYVTSGNGPVLESNMPISSVYSKENKSYVSNVEELDLDKEITGRLTESTIFPSICKVYSENKVTHTNGASNPTEYAEDEVKAIRNLIKESIKENGAIAAQMYSDIQIDQSGNYISEYFNPETGAYYCNDNTKAINHAVTIIGWDDNYAVNKFKTEKQPINPGAYIILNSYGTSFGKDGYMYISYEDFSIETFLVGIKEVKENKDYDNIYQYDELGVNYAISTGSNSIYAANIFTKSTLEDKDEYLNEVGIYLMATEGVEIYLSDNENLTNSKLVASPGALEAGYHTIKLSSPQKLTNEKFAVIIKYTNSEGASIPLEANSIDSKISFIKDQYSTATANEGESKYSIDGETWNEINNTKVGLTVTLKNTNNCIKAFTTYQEKAATIPVTGVEITEKNITLDKGNTANIVATVKPENATNKNITWSSSDESVATVQNGVVTGVSVGTATITVTTEDGAKTDTCTVTVNDNNQEEVIPVTEVKFDMELAEGVSLVVNKGTTYPVTVTVLPENATNKNVTWSSSDENIAKVENGVITGISEGTATITVTTQDGAKTASVPIKVVSNEIVPVESVSLNKQTLSLEVGDETNLVVSFNPSNASNKNVKWTRSNDKVATISDTGIIKAISEGTTTITVTSEDGNKSATCELTVVKKTNTDDDIYKDDDNKNTEVNADKDNNKKDTTTAKDKLPNTGAKIVLIVLLSGVLLIGTVAFVKYRKYIDVK